MFCINCGNQIPDGSDSCPVCGSPTPFIANKPAGPTNGVVPNEPMQPKAAPQQTPDTTAVTPTEPMQPQAAPPQAPGNASTAPTQQMPAAEQTPAPNTQQQASGTAPTPPPPTPPVPTPGAPNGKDPKNTVRIIIIIAVIAVIAAVIITLLAVKSCGNSTTANTGGTTSTGTTTSTVIPTTAPKTTAKPTPTSTPKVGAIVAGGQTFQGDGWTIQIPDSWNGLYGVDIQGSTVKFYSVHNKQAGYGGDLITIKTSNINSIQDPSYTSLGNKGGTFYFACYPTDARYDPNNSTYSDEYKTMYASVRSMAKTFKLS